MPISDVASLVGGAVLGAPVSEIFKLMIAGGTKLKDFKPISEDLVSTMERLVPLFKDIESMQQGSDTSMGELKFLIKTMLRADEVIRECSGLEWYNPLQVWYAMEIEKINQDFFKFCQVDLPVIIHRDQLRSMRSVESMSAKIDLLTLTDTAKGSADLFVVPQPETVTIFWLARAFRELKKMLLEDKVVTIVVSAPSPCGKTMLVTKLCHDADVKGKFKHILFITVSKAPNVRLIVQRFLQQTGREAKEFADNLDANRCIQQLLKQLGESGPILLVLDDVWPADESFLDKFLIQLPDYKILVTSRLEFLRFGPTYYLEPLIDEDFKNLFVACTLQSNCRKCTKRDDLLLKIGERCNWPFPAMNPPCSNSMCGGCNSEIENGRSVDVLGVLWHRECFCCDACHKPINIRKVESHVLNSRGKFHKTCHERYCYVCKETKMKNYNQHHFWKERYCRAHESDGTPKCCSCERLQANGTKNVMLGDGRWLCLECKKSAVMDTNEAQPLHVEIREFFEGLLMKIEKEFPFLLVEKQALNKAEEEEIVDCNDEVVTRGICLSETHIITSVTKRPRMGPHKQLIGMVTQSQRVVRNCEVTAILILYGLPRLLTGYILAHEMMHAYLRLNGHTNLNMVLEEGICQVLAHLWLESQTYATTDGSMKGEWASDFEKQLVKFCKNKIETDDSLHGVGFRKVNEMVTNSSLRETIKQIIR